MTGFALRVRASCSVLVLAASVLLATPAHAVDVQPGDDCSAKFVAGAYRPTGGPENPDGALLVCDGSVWQPILRYSSSGNAVSLGGGSLPAAPLHVWGEAIIGSNGLACSPAAEGAIRYTGGDPPWEFCNGADWVNFKQPRCQDDDTGECYLDEDRSQSDPDFVPENIVCGVNMLGVVGVCADCTLDGQDVSHGDTHTFYSETEHANCASVSQQRTCTDGSLDGSASYQYASCEAPASDPCETGPVGTVCTSDGAIYVGTTFGGARMYAAPSDEIGTYVWGGSGNFDGADSEADGLENTNVLVADGHSHPAAEACRDRGASWYLPAIDELEALWNLRHDIGGFDLSGNDPEGYYWSSTEASMSSAVDTYFSTGVQENSLKSYEGSVRCVRR